MSLDIKVRFAKNKLQFEAAAEAAWLAQGKIKEEGRHKGQVWSWCHYRCYVYRTKTAIVAVCQPVEDKKIDGDQP